MAKDPIKKADNGTYYFRANLGYNPITGKQIQKYRSGFKTKKEAREEYSKLVLTLLWSSIFVTLMANKIGGLQFGIYRNCQISSRVFHTAVAALPLTKANRSDFE